MKRGLAHVVVVHLSRNQNPAYLLMTGSRAIASPATHCLGLLSPSIFSPLSSLCFRVLMDIRSGLCFPFHSLASFSWIPISLWHFSVLVFYSTPQTWTCRPTDSRTASRTSIVNPTPYRGLCTTLLHISLSPALVTTLACTRTSITHV